MNANKIKKFFRKGVNFLRLIKNFQQHFYIDIRFHTNGIIIKNFLQTKMVLRSAGLLQYLNIFIKNVLHVTESISAQILSGGIITLQMLTCHNNKTLGRVYIADAVNMSCLNDNSYDFVMSSNNSGTYCKPFEGS